MSDKKRKGRFEVYKDKAWDWRWRLRSSNGRIIADSGQGYSRKEDCLHGIKLVSKICKGEA